MPPESYTSAGYQQMTVSTVSISPTVPAGSGARRCLVRVETNPVRWRDDGTAPTAAVGMPLLANEVLDYDGQPEDLKFIRSGGADATVNVAFYA